MPNKTDLRPENEIEEREAARFDLANREAQVGQEHVNSGLDQLEAYANDPKNRESAQPPATQQTAEQTANPMNWTGEGGTRGRARRAFVRVTGRKAATGGVVGLLFGGLLGFGVLLSPSIGIMHLSETMLNDLDDSVAALDSTHFKLLRTQIKDMGKPVSSCTLVKFRCGLKGMSDRQVKYANKAGIDVEVGDKDPVTRRSPVKSMTFTRADDTTVKVENVRELNKLVVDKGIRNQLRRMYNPHFYSVSDKLSSLTLRRLGLSRQNKFTADSEEENRRTYADATSDEKSRTVDADKRAGSDDPDANKAAEAENTERQKILDRLKGQVGASSLLKGGLRGVQITGAADAACTVYGLSRGVESGAKAIRAAQLMEYSSNFHAFANAQKAGDATAGASTMWGDVITATDTNPTVVNETSKDVNDEVPNPYHNKNGFDSAGFHVAAYNDAPTLTARDQSMMVGGSMVGTLAVLNNAISSTLGNPEKVCPFVQNWFVRGGSLILGLGLGIVSGGSSLAISVAGSLAVAAGAQILAAYLQDMIAGTTVNEDTEGVDSVNAIFAGTGNMLGALSLARGLKPASLSGLRTYLTKADEVKSEIAVMEQEDARDTPFDINNQYSFLGSLARASIPTTTNLSMASFSPAKFLASIPSALVPDASAAIVFNDERFQKCNDQAYAKMGIDADVFCNIRYVFPEEEMGANIEDVYEYMWDNRYVDEGGEPVDGPYQDWITLCAERETHLGVDPSDDVGTDIGQECVDGKNGNGDTVFTREQLKNIRVYQLTRTVEDGIENGPDFSPLGTADSQSGPVAVATFNVRGGSQSDGNFRERMDQSIKVIEAGGYDIVGFQEFETSQRAYFDKKAGDTYARYPEGSNNDGLRLSNSIAYNKDRFKVVKSKSGTVPNLKYSAGGTGGTETRALDAPYVMLQDIASGQEMYVINTHDPAGAGYAETRAKNATQYANFVERTLLRSNPDVPVVLTGDFNSSYTVDNGGDTATYQKNASNISYCAITSSSKIIEAYDSSSGRPEKCPNKPPDFNPLSQIYMSANIKASSYDFVSRGSNNGSDRPTISATLEVPGMGVGTGGSGEWSWPVDEKWWKANKADFLDAHTAVSGTYTSGVDSLAVDISSPSPGSPVYAIFGGKVTKADLGGHGLLITTDIQGGKLEIAYAHGRRANSNSTYKAGDKIMSIGALGNVTGPHLHVDMAFDDKGVCPQDVFIAFDKGQTPDFNQLTKKAIPKCGRL